MNLSKGLVPQQVSTESALERRVEEPVTLAKGGIWDKPRVTLVLGGDMDSLTYLSVGGQVWDTPSYPSHRKGILGQL